MQYHLKQSKYGKHDIKESYIYYLKDILLTFHVNDKWLQSWQQLSVIKHRAHFDLVHNALLIAANHPPLY